jgi:hypothetical protein
LFPNLRRYQDVKGLVTWDAMPVSKPFKPDSRELAICIKVLESRFKIKAIWLLNRMSTYAKYAFDS